MKETRRFVTIATCKDPIDAHVLRTRLESEGIFVIIKDEYTVAWDPLASNAIGGVRILVPGDQAAEAMAILGTKDKQLPVFCIRCGSADVLIDLPKLSIKQICLLAWRLLRRRRMTIELVCDCQACAKRWTTTNDVLHDQHRIGRPLN